MADPKPYIDKNGEVRDLDEHFFTTAKRGRPPMPDARRKRRVNLMLDPDVVEKLKAKGNMSAAANNALREALGI